MELMMGHKIGRQKAGGPEAKDQISVPQCNECLNSNVP